MAHEITAGVELPRYHRFSANRTPSKLSCVEISSVRLHRQTSVFGRCSNTYRKKLHGIRQSENSYTLYCTSRVPGFNRRRVFKASSQVGARTGSLSGFEPWLGRVIQRRAIVACTKTVLISRIFILLSPIALFVNQTLHSRRFYYFHFRLWRAVVSRASRQKNKWTSYLDNFPPKQMNIEMRYR